MNRIRFIFLAGVVGISSFDASAACTANQGKKYNRATLNQALNCLSGEATSLLSQLANAQSQIASLQTANFGGQVATISNRLSAAETEIATLRAQTGGITPGGVVSPAEFAAVKTDVAGIKTRLTAVESGLTVVKGDITSLKARLDALEPRVKNVEDNLLKVNEDVTFLKTNAAPTDAVGVYQDSFITVRVTGGSRKVDPNTGLVTLSFGLEIQNSGADDAYIGEQSGEWVTVQEDGSGIVCTDAIPFSGIPYPSLVSNSRTAFQKIAPGQSVFVGWTNSGTGRCTAFKATGLSYNLSTTLLRWDNAANKPTVLGTISFKHQIAR